MMNLFESFENFIWKIRFMWKAVGVVAEANRNIINMTFELSREVEKKRQLKAELKEIKVANAMWEKVADGWKARKEQLEAENEGLRILLIAEGIREDSIDERVKREVDALKEVDE